MHARTVTHHAPSSSEYDVELNDERMTSHCKVSPVRELGARKRDYRNRDADRIPGMGSSEVAYIGSKAEKEAEKEV